MSNQYKNKKHFNDDFKIVQKREIGRGEQKK